MSNKVVSAVVAWLVVVTVAVGCGSFRPEVPFVGDQGVRLCMMTVHPISWEPYPTPTSLYRADATQTPLPTRTLAPNAQMPNRVVIERGDLQYAGHGSASPFVIDQTWALEDAARVAQLYCSILTLPSARPNCPDSTARKIFRMQFKRDDTYVDDFIFINFGCSNVYLDLDPSARSKGKVLMARNSDERYTNGCFWKFLAETLNVTPKDLIALSQLDVEQKTRTAQDNATYTAFEAAAQATQERLEELTTAEIPSHVETRRARATLAAQTQTSTPTRTSTETPIFTYTPSPFPVVRSICQ